MTMFYRDIEEESPTDTSEDSIEVRVKPIKKTITMPSTPPSAKKNKRKSMEPKRLTTAEVTPSDIKRCRLNSTGSEDRSPPVSYNSESRSPSPVSPDSKSESSSVTSPSSKRTSLSPMCLAPKKRFKFDALRDIEQSNSDKEKVKSETELEDKDSGKSPFRPWSASGMSEEKLPPTGGAVPNVPYIPFFLPGLISGSVPSTDRSPAAAKTGPLPHPLQAILPLDPRLYSYLPPYLPLPGKSDTSSASLSLSSPTPPPQDEPLSLVIRDKQKDNNNTVKQDNKQLKPVPTQSKSSPIKPTSRPPAFNVEALMNAQKAALLQQSVASSSSSPSSSKTPPQTPTTSRTRHDSGSTSTSDGDNDKAKQRNYKNMTRERRVEANARERQRVHTITAAFDTLQAAIPTEEKDIKLSKLSVIKIATAYIMALSRMAGHDYTEDQSAPPVDEVVAHCSDVIEKECRIKKRNGSP